MIKNSFDLTGKVVLITGGNGGIGLAFAMGIAKAGGSVCIWGRNQEKNNQALQQLKALGCNAAAFVCDVSNEQDVNKCFQSTLDVFGRIDGCFANAGVLGNDSSFIDRSFDDWKKLMSINVDGVFLTLRAAAKHMVERAKNGDAFGRLVITSSTASRMGAARNEHYGTSKSAVNGLSKALAVELARYKITCNTILPGWVESEMMQSAVNNTKFAEKVISRVPARRWGNIQDLENVAVYLMSEGSSFHTGDELLIDGGYTQF
jgi:NAD(P)-dependent dehydrogenase (short-subunit alcohol dehydrogenase family)